MFSPILLMQLELWLLISLYMMAKCLVFDVTHSGRSFINIKNNSGPSTVPWGTPLTTLALPDAAPSTNTCCVLLLRKASIHL